MASDIDLKLPADLPEWPAKMRALANDNQRAFVVALFDEEAPVKGDGLLIWAARRAGYGTETSSNASLGVIGTRLAHDRRVQAAIAEYSRLVIRTISPEAIRALKEVVRNPKHRDHMRAIAAVADRVDPPEQVHKVMVDDQRPPSPEATQKVLDRIEELMRATGVRKPAPVIDGECKVIEERQ